MWFFFLIFHISNQYATNNFLHPCNQIIGEIMKFTPILIYTTLSLSCFAMDTTGDAKPSSDVVKRSLKRSFEDNSIKERDKGSQKRGFVQSPEQSEQEQKLLEFKLKINRKLLHKTAILMEVLPSVSESLEKIREELRVKARSSMDRNFERATELAGLGTSAMSLNKSTALLLNNLRPFFKGSKEESSLLNASLAIMGSGSLNNQINQFIDVLNRSDNTRDSK
jgi:hypothetical protein